MKRFIFYSFLILLLAGCEGKVTDVGNPSTNLPAPSELAPPPSTEQLLGNFAVSIPSANVGPGAVAPTRCQSNSKIEQKIVATQNPDEVILENFFSYSSSTQSILSDYDKQTGTFSFGITDETTVMDCLGRAFLTGSDVSIYFSCDVDKPVDHNCTITFLKD